MSMLIAFLVLRIVIAWFFLQPVKALCSNWAASRGMVALLFPYAENLLAALMIAVMIVGSLSVLFGIYAQIGAALLFIYTFIGIFVHLKLKNQILALKVSADVFSNDKKQFDAAKNLGVVGHQTSALKNIVIMAALWMIVLLGSGPFSVTGVL